MSTGGPLPPARRDVYVGLMSGTSLDGISAAVVRFAGGDGGGRGDGGDLSRCELLACLTRPYADEQRRRLERALRDGAPPAEWCQLGFDLGGWLADAAIAALGESGVPRRSVRAIGSHGHTVWHEPGRSTWQFGEAAVIAERTGIDVVSDFRVRDVAAGGQGAPLVAIADAMLFAPAAGGGWRALQNLGGIGNVTVVAGSGPGVVVRAFDTGPGVVVIDGVVRSLRPDLPFDRDGRLAAQGTPIDEVVRLLMTDGYFAAPPPKSTGRERFSAQYVADFIARCRARAPSASDPDVVATAVSLTAASIADAYRRFIPEPLGDVVLSGGGAQNPALVHAVVRVLAPLRVHQFSALYFDGEAKEAVGFALLAALHVADRPGNVPAATGAHGPRVLGKLTPGMRD